MSWNSPCGRDDGAESNRCHACFYGVPCNNKNCKCCKAIRKNFNMWN